MLVLFIGVYFFIIATRIFWSGFVQSKRKLVLRMLKGEPNISYVQGYLVYVMLLAFAFGFMGCF